MVDTNSVRQDEIRPDFPEVRIIASSLSSTGRWTVSKALGY